MDAQHALLLDGATQVRFSPNSGYDGNGSLTFHGWDETNALAVGTHVDISGVSATGGTTAFSIGSATAQLTDLTPPPAPVITGFASDSGTVGDHMTNDNTLVISGTAEIGSTVQVFRNGTSIGTAAADGTG